MSAREQRRRTNPPVTVKQAFEENENENKSNTQYRSHEYESPLNGNIDIDRYSDRAFFTLNDSTVEVILNNEILSWITLKNEMLYQSNHRKANPNMEDVNSINLRDVYAVSPMFHQYNWLLQNNEDQSNMGVSTPLLRGFQLHSYETMDDNILQEILVIFQSNSPNQIQQWYQLLSQRIAQYKPARNILVFCNPYTGTRRSRYVYDSKIKPMLDRANYNVTYLEIDDLCSADEALCYFQGDFDSLYGSVIIGGDGTVTNVINALLRYLAKENRTRLEIDYGLPSLPFPICIVPLGTTNIICHSIYGCTDHITPILYLLFNKQMKIDMSAVFDVNYNFITANFSAGAGYPANALKYFTRYSSHNPKKIIRKSFAKAASNKNLKPIEMEIRYIPADQDSVSFSRCYRGCPSCTQSGIEEVDDQVTTFNQGHVQKLDKRKTSTSTNKNNNRSSSSLSRRSSYRQINTNKSWTVLSHEYLQVAVLTNANLWSFAPQGLSKFGHLADGLLDLILIESTTRKEFLRYIKRNGNSKNQFELSFTKTIKVKEIELELKFPNDYFMDGMLNIDDRIDSSSSDDSSNEENASNENRTSSTQKYEPRPPNIPIPEDSRRPRRRNHQHLNEKPPDSSSSVFESWENFDTPKLHAKNRDQHEINGENPFNGSHTNLYGSSISIRRKSIFQSLKSKFSKTTSSRPSSADANGRKSIDGKQNKKTRGPLAGTFRSAGSLMNLLPNGNSSSRKREQSLSVKQDALSTTTTAFGYGRHSLAISGISSTENENVTATGNNYYRNKKQPCMWNLDFTPYNSSLIRIKCFYRFLPVFGLGVHPDTVLKSVNYPCLGRIG